MELAPRRLRLHDPLRNRVPPDDKRHPANVPERNSVICCVARFVSEARIKKSQLRKNSEDATIVARLDSDGTRNAAHDFQ